MVFGKGIRRLDAFSKIVPDAQVRTSTGGLITIASMCLIMILIVANFLSYRTIIVRPELVVDKTRGERMSIHFNITFPHVPCSMLSLDVMDQSGEIQQDISHTVSKTRLSQDGSIISQKLLDTLGHGSEWVPPEGYCGSCYGADPPPGKKCCNSCEDVRKGYEKKGWVISDHDEIEQCKNENYKQEFENQLHEGCRMDGYLEVNKVVGQFHFAPGRSFQSQQGMHVHDTSQYIRGKHDFSHTIHSLRFGENVASGELQNNPLSGTVKNTNNKYVNFVYFIKCVSTTYTYLSGQPSLSTNQYSVTSHERSIEGGVDPEHENAVHGKGGIPGIFFSYDISPMRVIQRETRQGSLGEFISTTVGIVGGVLVIAQALDRAIFEGARVSFPLLFECI